MQIIPWVIIYVDDLNYTANNYICNYTKSYLSILQCSHQFQICRHNQGTNNKDTETHPKIFIK